MSGLKLTDGSFEAPDLSCFVFPNILSQPKITPPPLPLG